MDRLIQGIADAITESGRGMTDTPEDGQASPGDQAARGVPGTGENVCPVCRGTGRADQGVCPHCSGDGVVIEGIGGG